MKFSRIVTAAVVTMMALPSYAMSVTETGDAGQLLNTAQSFAQPGALDSISGKLAKASDRVAADYADMFKIWITGKTSFSASTVNASTGNPTTTFDTQLFLFDSLGRGVIANDDVSSSVFQSTIKGSFKAGYYYLAVSGYNNDPVSGTKLIFPNSPFTAMVAATNPNLSITGWSTPSNPGVGNYRINLTGVATIAPAPVPLPPAVFMFGSAITAFSLVRRRTKKTA